MQTYSVSGQSVTVDPDQGYAILRGKRYIAVSEAYHDKGHWKIRFLCPDNNTEFFLHYDLPQGFNPNKIIFQQPTAIHEI